MSGLPVACGPTAPSDGDLDSSSEPDSTSAVPTTGGPSDSACRVAAQHAAMCLDEPDNSEAVTQYAQFCEDAWSQALAVDGEACLRAMDAYLVCISEAACEAFLLGAPSPCPEVEAQVAAECSDVVVPGMAAAYSANAVDLVGAQVSGGPE